MHIITVEPSPLKIIGETHFCWPSRISARHENGSGQITEYCSCGAVRHSEQWPWGETSVGQWVHPESEAV